MVRIVSVQRLLCRSDGHPRSNVWNRLLSEPHTLRRFLTVYRCHGDNRAAWLLQDLVTHLNVTKQQHLLAVSCDSLLMGAESLSCLCAAGHTQGEGWY